MNTDRIDQYILNRMTEKERLRFEREMESDPALKEEVNISKTAKEASENLGRQNLKASLQNIHSELYDQPKRSNSKKIIIGSLLLLISALITFWLLQTKTLNSSIKEPAEIFAQYYKPIDYQIGQRSDGTNPLEEIKEFYDQKNYGEVIIEANNILSNQEVQSSNILLIKAIANIELKNNDSAIASLNKIIENKDFNYEDQARWYLALIYLNEDKVNEAKKYLKFLADDKTADHHLEASDILKKLNKR